MLYGKGTNILCPSSDRSMGIAQRDGPFLRSDHGINALKHMNQELWPQFLGRP